MTTRRTAVVAAIVVVVFALIAGGILIFAHHKGHSSSTAPTTTSTTSSTTSTTAPTTTTTTLPPVTTTTAPKPTTTTSSSTTSTTAPTTTTRPPAGVSPTFPQLVSQIQTSLRTGKLAGASPVPDAALSCPHPVSIVAGDAFACNVSSQSVGSAYLVVEITSAAGSYTPFIGDTIGCSGLTPAGRAALKTVGTACNP